jgi:hypothetical protein
VLLALLRLGSASDICSTTLFLPEKTLSSECGFLAPILNRSKRRRNGTGTEDMTLEEVKAYI